MAMLHAYDDLASCKPDGMNGRGRVPWDRVVLWGQHHGLPYSVINHLWRVIRLVDQDVMAKGRSQ